MEELNDEQVCEFVRSVQGDFTGSKLPMQTFKKVLKIMVVVNVSHRQIKRNEFAVFKMSCIQRPLRPMPFPPLSFWKYKGSDDNSIGNGWI